MNSGQGWLTLDELSALVEGGDIDTVLVVVTDMQGRLQGKRFDARHFLSEVVEHATEGCTYLLAVDVDMNTVDGYAFSSWETGYGDFVLKPDVPTLRLLPWHTKSAVCQADIVWESGEPVSASPREILRRQVSRLADRGWTALGATELEFLVFEDTYEEAFDAGYRNLTPANRFNSDYSIMGTSRIEPLLGRIRREMAGAGMHVESVKGECNLGQHELTFKYDQLVAKADEHALFKTGAKEIASQEGFSITFMAKYDAKEGNSCHVHLSMRDAENKTLFQGEGPHGMSELMQQFLAGLLDSAGDLTLFYAPNVNSYKRYASASFAPTAIAWGRDNRTCAFRVVGHGESIRIESRIAGGDMNPYLGLAAIVAGGLHGIENRLKLEAETTGNAYTSDAPRLPATMREAMERLSGSEIARKAFGDDVVDHYLNMARVELRAYDSAVTDWERYRGFERM